MKKLTVLSILMILTVCGCFTTNAASVKFMEIKVNPAHLNYLCQDVTLPNGKKSILVHIYADYPSYKWVKAPGEGIACIDDASRAGVFYYNHYLATGDKLYLDKIQRLVNFILYLQADNGYFYNFVFADLKPNKTYKTSVATPNWWSYRALWFLGYVYPEVEKSDPALAKEIKSAMIKTVNVISKDFKPSDKTAVNNGIVEPAWLPNDAADQSAIILMGLSYYHKINSEDSSKTAAIMNKLADGLMMMQIKDKASEVYGAFLCWENQWHGWGNNIAYSLLLAGKELKNQKYIDSALLEINHFQNYLIKQNYMSDFTVKKVNGTVVFDKVNKYPQIAYTLRPLIFSAMEAYRITDNQKYADQAVQLALWFFGKNPAKAQMYDPSTGLVYDGINSATDYNKNSGAESTIECLLALNDINSIKITRNMLFNEVAKGRKK